jgi:hypothetical protein
MLGENHLLYASSIHIAIVGTTGYAVGYHAPWPKPVSMAAVLCHPMRRPFCT